MTILLNADGHEHGQWCAAIKTYLPAHDIVQYPYVPDVAAIDYALIWNHPDGDLDNYPNLRAVFSLGSGVDYLDRFLTLPDAPIFRLVDPSMAQDMAHYVLYWTLHYQRAFETYRLQQQRAQWASRSAPRASEFTVSLLGLGAIGSHIAKTLAASGFTVLGWSRSPKALDGVVCRHGEQGLASVLSEADLLVCCLPLTPKTDGFLDVSILSSLRRGAVVVNVSRGAVMNEADLLSGLDSGHISGAVLDVFSVEPLPAESSLWTHPNIHITPHISGATGPGTAMQIIARQIADFERGILPPHPYLRETPC